MEGFWGEGCAEAVEALVEFNGVGFSEAVEAEAEGGAAEVVGPLFGAAIELVPTVAGPEAPGVGAFEARFARGEGFE